MDWISQTHSHTHYFHTITKTGESWRRAFFVVGQTLKVTFWVIKILSMFGICLGDMQSSSEKAVLCNIYHRDAFQQKKWRYASVRDIIYTNMYYFSLQVMHFYQCRVWLIQEMEYETDIKIPFNRIYRNNNRISHLAISICVNHVYFMCCGEIKSRGPHL